MFRTLYRGCGPALVQIVPYMGINFAVYDSLVRRCNAGGGKGADVGRGGVGGGLGGRCPATLAVCGMAAGACGKLCVYPLDTVKLVVAKWNM